MSSLYDKVEKVINASDMDEAEELLYGREGIQINSREYYDKIIANFVKMKENILPKDNNGMVIYDLDNNTQDVYDIVMIGQIVKKYFKEELERLEEHKRELENEIESLDEKIINKRAEHDKPGVTGQQHQIIESEKKLMEAERSFKNGELKKTIKQLDSINNFFSDVDKIIIKSNNDDIFDKESLKESIKELKESIIAVAEIRNSLSHREKKNDDDVLIIDKMVVIEDDKLKLKIPIEYLDGFTKGRIILKEEDKYIIKEVNDIVYPLLEELNFDPKKLESFFYNVEPSTLSTLLELFDFDVSKLYELSFSAFNYPNNTIMLYDFFKDKKVDVEKLSFFAFLYPNNVIDLYNELKKVDITKLPDEAFIIKKDTLMLYNELKGIDITKLPKEAFMNVDNTLKLYNVLEGVKITKLLGDSFEHPENIIVLYNFLKEKGVDVSKIPVRVLRHPNDRKMMSKYFKEVGIDVEKVPSDVLKNKSKYYDPNSLLIFLVTFRDTFLIEELSEIAFVYPANTIILYNFFERKGLAHYIVELPNVAFEYPKAAMELYDEGMDLKQLSIAAFLYPQNAVDLNNFFKEREFDITSLPDEAFENPQNTKSLYIYFEKRGININTLPLKSFKDPDNLFLLYDYFEKIGIDINYLPKKFINGFYLGDNISEDTVKRNIEFLLKRVDGDYSRLDEFPIEFYTCDYELLDEMCKRYDSNLCKSIFGINNPKIIGLLIYTNSVLAEYSNKNSTNINMNIENVMKSAAKDTIKYKDNIMAISMDSNKYINQFLYDDESSKIIRTNENIKKHILNKLRNATAHFRFKLVKDNDGNIIEDKIYLYDQDNMGNNNFNIIIDIKDLLNIVRDIELDMDRIKEPNNNYNSIQDELVDEERGRNR